MTTLIIKSDSKEKTNLLLQLVEDLGLSANTHDFVDLDVNAMVHGIGRKATEEELMHYLSKGNNAEPIDLDRAFSKYTENK